MFQFAYIACPALRLFVALIALAVCSLGCQSRPAPTAADYVATLPPLKMIIEPLVAGRKSVTSLLPPGASPHTFTLSPADAIALDGAEAVFHIDTTLDGWVVAMGGAKTVAVLDMLPEGDRMAYPESVGHGHDGDPHGDTNPHFWSDPKVVAALIPPLCEKLIELDPEGRSQYESNAATFLDELSVLDRAMTEQMAGLAEVPIVAFHPSWSYFCARYGLNVLAYVEPIPGKELSPRTILAIREQLGGAERVLVLSEVQLPRKSADALAEALGAEVEVIDPLGGHEPLTTYSRLIEGNAKRLKAALQ